MIGSPVHSSSLTSNSTLWKVSDIFRVLLIYFCLLILFFLAEIQLVDDILLDESKMPPFLFFVEETVDALIFTSVPLYFVMRRYQAKVSTLCLHTRDLPKNIAIGTAAGALVWLGLIPFHAMITSLIGEGPIKQPLTSRLIEESGIADYLAVIVSGALLAPVSEEVFFRGFTYRIFRKHYTRLASVVFTNLLFCLVHISPWWWPEVFVIGVALTLLVDYSESLVSPIIAHSWINVLSLTAHYLRL